MCVVGVLLSAGAQAPLDKPVKEVRLEGLERISEQLVRSQIEVQPGQTYNPRAVARDIRRLYDQGFFSVIKADAAIEDGGIVLTYVLEEKKAIEGIKIIGNKKVRDRLIRGVISWREGDTFVEDGYSDERDAILRLYQSKGFSNASVDIVVEEVGPSRVRITYVIEEGKKARIRSIKFAGNDTVSNRKLKKSMKTRRAWWFLGGTYDEEQFDADLKSILDTYGDYGRLEAAIANTEFAYRKEGKGLDITIGVNEGPEYRVGELEVAGNTVYDDDEILKLLKVQGGDMHNKGQIEKDAQLITKGHVDSGYLNAQDSLQVTLDRDTKTTHLVHRIEEGDLKYVQEIDITGNSVTRDDVIRREILQIPGERFDGSLLEASQRRLEGTEYFDEVRFTFEDLEDDMFSNLLVDVEEGKTGFFNFGAGYSTEEQFGGYTELRLKNFDLTNPPSFSGGGQQFRLRLHLGTRRTQYSLSFTDPEILGYPLAFGVDLSDESYTYSGGTDYTEQTQGAQIRLAKILSPFVSVRTALRYRNMDISDTDLQELSIYERLKGGDTTISSIWGINRTTLDRKYDPSRGSTHDLHLELAGVGGDNHFVKLEHDSTWYKALGEERKWVFSYRTREGIAIPYSSPDLLPLSDRFFAGGTSTVRGYDSRDIGPQAKRYTFFGPDERIGGELRLINNAEVKYKLTEMFRLYAFVDAGGVWEDPSDFDFGDVRFGAGIGFGVDIPKMGPVRVDLGVPLNADSDQGSGRIHLQTGFRF